MGFEPMFFFVEGKCLNRLTIRKIELLQVP